MGIFHRIPSRLQLPLSSVCECYHSRLASQKLSQDNKTRVAEREPHSVDRPPPTRIIFYFIIIIVIQDGGKPTDFAFWDCCHLRERAIRNSRRITCLADRPRDRVDQYSIQSWTGAVAVSVAAATIIPRETPAAS